MNYPIFDSLTKQLESELANRGVKIAKFTTWNERSINATGLEITIDLSEISNNLKYVSINVDWDKFREQYLAQKLEGMEKHPLLVSPTPISESIRPIIDIEVIWNLNEKLISTIAGKAIGNRRVELASLWMERINEEVHEMFVKKDIFTRWHVELEGDISGRYVSTMSLISYFQYDFQDLSSLSNIHRSMRQKLLFLLKITNSVISFVERSFPKAA